jgi:hypothetical protein
MRSSTLALILTLATAVHAQVPDRDWYHPPPPVPTEKFALVPIEAEQVVVPVPSGTRTEAIERLAESEIIPLTARDCRALQVKPAPDNLLRNLIEARFLLFYD